MSVVPAQNGGYFFGKINNQANGTNSSFDFFNMNPIQHARLSARRRGGVPDDYVAIHALIDSTKMLCSDNRHRILHTFWAVQEVVIPVFGHTLRNSEGREVDIKDLCEKDHLLPDFQHRFIPTLSDFVAAMDEVPTDGLAQRIERFHADVVQDTTMSARLLSPLAATGRLASLLITHNSWFVHTMLPMMGYRRPALMDLMSPACVFDAMRFELWMDNGADVPPSARRLPASVSNKPISAPVCSTVLFAH